MFRKNDQCAKKRKNKHEILKVRRLFRFAPAEGTRRPRRIRPANPSRLDSASIRPSDGARLSNRTFCASPLRAEQIPPPLLSVSFCPTARRTTGNSSPSSSPRFRCRRRCARSPECRLPPPETPSTICTAHGGRSPNSAAGDLSPDSAPAARGRPRLSSARASAPTACRRCVRSDPYATPPPPRRRHLRVHPRRATGERQRQRRRTFRLHSLLDFGVEPVRTNQIRSIEATRHHFCSDSDRASPMTFSPTSKASVNAATLKTRVPRGDS